MVTTPSRAAPLLAAIDSTIVPAPLPDWPLTTVIHDTVVPAVHEHPIPAVRTTDTLPPAAVAAYEPSEIAKLHPGGGGAADAPACTIENVCEPIVIVA